MPKRKQDKTRLEDLQVDYTPAALVRQLMSELRSDLGLEVKTFLDPSAGSGIFSKVVKEYWPMAFRVAIEIRPEEQSALEQCNESVFMCGFDEWHDSGGDTATFDLIATNPPFKFLAPKDLANSWLPKLLGRLNSGGVLALYATNDFGQRSQAGSDLFLTSPPTLQLRIPGSVSHRADKKVDLRDYSFWVWDTQYPTDNKGRWITKNLQRLDSKKRRVGNDELDVLPGV